MTTPMALICKALFPSISTFETPPSLGLRGPLPCPAGHEHGSASPTRSPAVVRSTRDGPAPLAFLIPPWGAPRGAPLPPRTPDRAPRPRLESRDMERGPRRRVADAALAPAPALPCRQRGGRGARVPVRLWPWPRWAALCHGERGAPAPVALPVVARGCVSAQRAGHAPSARSPHSRCGR